MQQKTVYMPTGEDTNFAVSEFQNGTFTPIFENVEKMEGYFFTEEELMDFLKDVCGGYYGFRQEYIDNLFTPKNSHE